MKVKADGAAGASQFDTGHILDFSKDTIYVCNSAIGDITSDKIIQNEGWCRNYFVQACDDIYDYPASSDDDYPENCDDESTGGKGGQGEEEVKKRWIKLHCLANVAVKCNPAMCALLENEEKQRTNAMISRINELKEKLENGLISGMVRKKLNAIALKNTKNLRGEDEVWRLLDQLPVRGVMHMPASEEVPQGEVICNICDRSLLEGERQPKWAKEKFILNCIRADMERTQKSGGRKPGAARNIENLNNAIMEHSSKCHLGGIIHYFASPKVPRSIWLWEMTVAYVAQVLLEESLFQVGLNKVVFCKLVKGDAQGVLAQVSAILGGAATITSDSLQQKLLGCKGMCYLPGKVDSKAILSKDVLGKVRREAVNRVVGRAKRWIVEKLLPEMYHFDYTILATAIANLPTERKLIVDNKKVTYSVDETHHPGYLWNAFGLFFRRGLLDSCKFAPGEISLGCKEELNFSGWDAFSVVYKEKIEERDRKLAEAKKKKAEEQEKKAKEQEKMDSPIAASAGLKPGNGTVEFKVEDPTKSEEDNGDSSKDDGFL